MMYPAGYYPESYYPGSYYPHLAGEAVPIGQAVEVSAAGAFGYSRARALLQALETDQALPLPLVQLQDPPLPAVGLPLFEGLGGAVLEAFGEPEPFTLERVASGQVVDDKIGVYDARHFEVDQGGEATVSEYQVSLACRRVDVEPVAYGDRVFVRDTWYSVRDIAPNQEGWTVLSLALTPGAEDNSPLIGLDIFDGLISATLAAFGEVEPVLWITSQGQTPVDMVFDGRAIETLLRGTVTVTDQAVSGHLARADVPGIDTTQQIRVRGVTFGISDLRPDGEGWLVVDLRRAS